MKHEIFYLFEQFVGRRDVNELLESLEVKVRAPRGPQSTISIRTVIIGLVAAMFVQGSPQASVAVKLIEGMHRDQRERLGIGHNLPTISQFRRRVQRLETVARESAGGELEALYEVMQDFNDVLVSASTVPIEGPATLAVDTTLFDAHTPHYSQAEINMINDPALRPLLIDSTKRGLRRLALVEESTLRRHVDLEASYRVIERFTGREVTLGYGGIAVVQVAGDFEQCLRVTARSANQHDVPPAVASIRSILAQGTQVALVLGDRGFSQSAEQFLDGLRSLGLPLVFDLKANQQGYRGMVNGCLEIDGWLFLPSLPKKYWNLIKPQIIASDADKAEYLKLVTERAQWALRVKQAVEGDPSKSRKVQLYSPVVNGSSPKGSGVRCDSCVLSMANPNPKLKRCRQGCKPGQGCATKTIVWGAKQCPDTYQPVLFGTADWNQDYAPRTGVERFFSRLKNAKGVDFVKALKVRGLFKINLMTALAAVATNLRLRYNRAYAAGWRGPDE